MLNQKILSLLLIKNGILLVLRKNREIDGIQQISLLENTTEKKFLDSFKKWFKRKSEEYIDSTLGQFFVGNYKRETPRILLYHISKKAEENYFRGDDLYKKSPNSPTLLGFSENSYKNNFFIRDIQENDIFVLINATGTRCNRSEFIQRIKQKEIQLNRIVCYKCKSKIKNKTQRKEVDNFYWKDEIESKKIIYPYICEVEEVPFINKHNICMPYIKTFPESTWEAIRSCLHHSEYRELSYLDFTLFISSLLENS